MNEWGGFIFYDVNEMGDLLKPHTHQRALSVI